MSGRVSPFYNVYVNGLKPSRRCSGVYGIVVQGANEADRAKFAGRVADLTGQGREYYALIKALKLLVPREDDDRDRSGCLISCLSSSQNVVNQMNGAWGSRHNEEDIAELKKLGNAFREVRYDFRQGGDVGIRMARDVSMAAVDYQDGEFQKLWI